MWSTMYAQRGRSDMLNFRADLSCLIHARKTQNRQSYSDVTLCIFLDSIQRVLKTTCCLQQPCQQADRKNKCRSSLKRLLLAKQTRKLWYCYELSVGWELAQMVVCKRHPWRHSLSKQVSHVQLLSDLACQCQACQTGPPGCLATVCNSSYVAHTHTRTRTRTRTRTHTHTHTHTHTNSSNSRMSMHAVISVYCKTAGAIKQRVSKIFLHLWVQPVVLAGLVLC